MALIRGNLDIADLILNSIILRLEDMRFGSQNANLHYVNFILRAPHLSFVASKLDKSVALVKVALSVTAGGYHALTKESMQDIRWSMQGYRKALVKEVGAEAVILNLLQQLIRFSSTRFILHASLLVSNLTGETVHTFTSPETILFFRYPALAGVLSQLTQMLQTRARAIISNGSKESTGSIGSIGSNFSARFNSFVLLSQLPFVSSS